MFVLFFCTLTSDSTAFLSRDRDSKQQKETKQNQSQQTNISKRCRFLIKDAKEFLLLFVFVDFARCHSHKKLRAVGVFPAVGHGQQEGSVVFEDEVFICGSKTTRLDV